MNARRPKIVVTNWVHDEVMDVLSAGGQVVANRTREPWTRDEILAEARDADALMAFMPDSVDGDFLDQCPNLRIVACALKGADNFDTVACAERGIWLSLVPDLLTAPTAELAIGLMIGLARHVPAGDEHIRTGTFNGWRPKLYGTGLDGSTVGLIGAGAVGLAIARRLSGFGCQILFTDPSPPPAAAVDAAGMVETTLRDLIETSDYVVSAAPLTADAHHLLDAEAISRMKPGALLINISRGSVVDEAAVADALEMGQLAGYAADVFEMEDWLLPDRPRTIDARLLAMRDKTLFTPHIGSAVDHVRIEIALAAARNILQVLNGEPPADAINGDLMTAPRGSTETR